jgi:hypothetical protein
MNNEINIELLKNISERLLNYLRKHCNLEFFITENYVIHVYHKANKSSYIFFKSTLNNVQPIIGIIYSFLMNHNDNTLFGYCYSCSIFKYAELCRNHFVNVLEHRPIKANTISYEICYSEAGQIIKSLGFPTSLEELAIKMNLVGI